MTTLEDIEDCYYEATKLVKAIAIYRDGSKAPTTFSILMKTPKR